MAPGYKQQRIEIRVDPFALLLVAFICQYNSETVNDSVKGCLRRVSFCLDLPHHLTGGNPRCRMGSPAVRVFNPVRACRAVILSLVAIAAVAACVVPSTTTVAEPTKGSDEAAPGLVTATVTVIDASSAGGHSSEEYPGGTHRRRWRLRPADSKTGRRRGRLAGRDKARRFGRARSLRRARMAEGARSQRCCRLRASTLSGSARLGAVANGDDPVNADDSSCDIHRHDIAETDAHGRLNRQTNDRPGC